MNRNNQGSNNHGTSLAPEFVRNARHVEVKQKACRPVKKFGFLKTHKCGSTTVQNMLLRYVVKHDLNLVVPVDGEDSRLK